MRRRSAVVLALLLMLSIVLGFSPRATQAAAPPAGYKDGLFGSATGDDPTADKPQSKLWYNDGSWWAVMFNQSAGNWRIYKLTWPSAWGDTGIVVDTRATSRADVLWDGSKLFIASLVRFDASNQGKLARYSYNASSNTYTLDAPAVTIMSGSAETLALDKDTTGRLWIAYTQSKKVYVNTSDISGLSWGTPFQLPGSSAVGSDDIASLVAYKDQAGPSVGVLWSSHSSASSASAMYFARHTDSDAPGTWQPVEQIYGGVGSCLADDHINLKSLQDDPSTGALFAAVKTSAGDSGCPSGATDAILLVVRNPNNTWKWTTFGATSEQHTRPLVLLDSDNRTVYMFATSPTSCGTIYMKSTSMANPSFASGLGTSFISASGACINNATSTKQPVGNASGLVVLASDQTNKYYYHNLLTLGSPPADTTPPTLIATSPANGATGVSVASSVTASFSEAINASTLSSATFRLLGPSGPIAATVSYNAAGKIATLAPSASLSAGISYTAMLSGTITDLAGNALATPSSWTFSTVAAPPSDTTPPTVSATTPANSAANVSTGTIVTASSSEPLDASTVTNANFTLTGPSGAVSASVTYNSGTNTAMLQPNAALVASTSYTAQIGGVKDLAGNPLAAAYSWTFSTAAATPPGTAFTFGPVADTYVGQASPTSNYATNNQLQVVGGSSSAKQLFIRFNVSGLPAGAAVSAAKLRLYITNDSTSGGVFNAITNTSWAENITWNTKPGIDGPQVATLGAAALNSTVEVDLTSAIGGNGSYSFAISLPSSNTNTLAYASREYSTVANRPQLLVTIAGSTPADTTPPTVSGVTPANSAANVSTSASVTATFSEPVDASTVTSSNFTLTGPNGSVLANVTYNSGTNTATLQPSAALAASTSYSAQAAGVKDLAGNSLASAYSWSFSTAATPPANTTPPTVLATSPANSATGVSVASSVTATFSEAINAGTLSSATFQLLGPGGPVAATVSYDAVGNIATLAPSASLSAGISYTAMLTGTITDLAGNPLATPKSWLFTTTATPPPATSFTFGPVADTYVSQASPSNSYATSNAFSAVDSSVSAKQIYIRFTVSGLPTGAAVSSAKLRLYVTNDSTSGGIVQSVSNTAWLEALTWSSKPAIDGPVRATFGAVAVNTIAEVDLGVAITGNGSYSFVIALPAGNTNTVGYASRESTSAGNRPQLVITTN